MATLEDLREQCTIILIAHRASSVRRCDLIFELSGGTVAAAGTYAELTRQSERFERLLHGADVTGRPLREPAAAGAHKE